jgi:glycosyltransferase involved in cell wall biosynthesis
MRQRPRHVGAVKPQRPLLLMCHDYPPWTGGGLAGAVGDLTRLLHDDYEIVVVSSRLVDHFADDRASTPGRGRISTTLTTWHLLRRADCVLVHWTFSFRWLSSLVIVLGPITRCPTVCVIHTAPMHCRYNRLRALPAPVRRGLLRLVVAATRRCGAVIALSSSHAGSLAAIGLRATHIMPAPVAAPQRYADVYRHHFESAEVEVVGYAGEFSDLKGADALPALVAAGAPEFSFRIAGRGPLAATLRSRIDALDPICKERVVLSDRLKPSHMDTFFARVDVVLVCSQTESQSRLAIEAMLAGVVVLAREVEGVTDIVQHGRSGFFMDPDDPVGFVDQLRSLRADPALLRSVRSCARATACALVADAELAWPRLLAHLMRG